MLTPQQREEERALFETERERVPNLFERDPMVDSPEFLELIGISQQETSLPIGYLKLLPQDFIVEEISQDGNIHTVDADFVPTEYSEESRTLYADLVKIGISTFDAQEQLAEVLGIEQKRIGYAGIKDRAALTSQAISIRGVLNVEKIAEMNEDNFFLKNLRQGKGVIANGDLKGNRFSIAVRLQQPCTEDAVKQLLQQAERMQKEGFWNFFSFQRFGTPRLLSHRLGLFIIKGEYENAVKMFLSYPASRELPYFQNMRDEIKKLWGDWEGIQKYIQRFPYHFHIELQLIGHLIDRPGDFLGALHTIPDQVRLWVYAYDSYLFNRKLSQLIQKGEIPFTLPLLTSFNSQDWEPYKEFLKADKIDNPSLHYKDFPFIRVASRAWPTFREIEVQNITFRDNFAFFAFTLPKGSYATTFLMNFFNLASGMPVVEGIPTHSVDIKEVLGLGTLSPTLKRFQTVLEQREQDIQAGGKEKGRESQ